MTVTAFNDNIIYLISSFAHQFSRLLTNAFHQAGIPVTAEQFAILMLLAGQEGMPQQEISRRLERDKTTVTRVLLNLKKQGLVRQQDDKVDTRAKNVHLTAAGKKQQALAIQVAGGLYTRVLSGIGAKEIQQGIKLLQRMNAAVKANQ